MVVEDVFITFEKRAVPVPPSYRILYKIALITLILYNNSRGKKSSILKIQFFNWALKSKENQLKFENLVKQQEDTSNFWSLDPTVLRAMDFAKAEGLVEFESGGVKLTTKGSEFSKSILNSESSLKEIEFLNGVGLSVTEKLVTKLSKSWSK